MLTHLDLIKKTSTLRESKSALKKRFWTEIYQGAKLFYLSGVLNGRYPDNEILNLSRFIAVMKFRPLVFRNSHPYLLADRMEDLTPREEIQQSEGKCDRRITLYGYLRGTNLQQSSKIHIPGAGDFGIASSTRLNDPCPLPSMDSEKRRKLSEKQKLIIHAPMSDVGGVMYDKDAVYVNVPGTFSRENIEGVYHSRLSPASVTMSSRSPGWRGGKDGVRVTGCFIHFTRGHFHQAYSFIRDFIKWPHDWRSGDPCKRGMRIRLKSP